MSLAPTSTALAADPTAASTVNPLSSLTSNFGSFLNLLMTQLRNQDPTSPMDSNAFTTELVQFSGVEQQITANNSLTQLIQLTQASDVTQAAGMLGKQVTAQSTMLPLVNGAGTLSFTAPGPEAVTISLQNSNGAPVARTTVDAVTGANTWTWNGASTAGTTQPDGAYTVTVTGADGAAVPFAIIGTATGVTTSGGAVTLRLGPVSVPFSAVTAVTNAP